ncbi:MAG: hypothetical protein ACRELA_18220 [Candidatus Rokuibacteriota bacterium]
MWHEQSPRRGVVGATRTGAVALLVLSALGCAGLLRPPLDVPPGQRIVVGRLDLSAFEVGEGLLEIVREDGTFYETVRAGLSQRDFVMALPPGAYRVVRLRAFRDGRKFPNDPIWDLRLAFDVGPEPAIYIGTLRLRSHLGHRLDTQVLDEYDDTLRVLRARHPDLPDAVGRSLLRPN